MTRPLQGILQIAPKMLLHSAVLTRGAGGLRTLLLRKGMEKLRRTPSRRIRRAMASLLHTLYPRVLNNLAFMLGDDDRSR